jgi:hypothetical protein
MNVIRTIESVTLVSVGAFCAAAVSSIILHSAQVLPSPGVSAYSDAATAQVQTIVVSAKRMTAAEKAKFAKAQALG